MLDDEAGLARIYALHGQLATPTARPGGGAGGGMAAAKFRWHGARIAVLASMLAHVGKSTGLRLGRSVPDQGRPVLLRESR